MELFWADSSDEKGVIPMVLLPAGVTLAEFMGLKGDLHYKIKQDNVIKDVYVLSPAQIKSKMGLSQADLRRLAGDTDINLMNTLHKGKNYRHRIFKDGNLAYVGLQRNPKSGSGYGKYQVGNPYEKPSGYVYTELPLDKTKRNRTLTSLWTFRGEVRMYFKRGHGDSPIWYGMDGDYAFGSGDNSSFLTEELLSASPVENVPRSETWLSNTAIQFIVRDRNGKADVFTIHPVISYDSHYNAVTGKTTYSSAKDLGDNFGVLTVNNGMSVYPGDPYDFTALLSGLPGSEPPPPPKERFDIMKRFSPRIYTNGLGIYFLDKTDTQKFTAGLWETGFKEAFIREVNGNPTDSVISFKYYYGLKDFVTEIAPKDVYLAIGNVVFDGTMIGGGSRIVCKTATSEFARFSFGEITIPRKFNNFLDMSPFTGVTLYIPYVGYVNLDATEVVGQTLEVLYHLNLITGAIQAFVYKKRGANWTKIHTSSGDMGMDIPLNVDAKEGILTKMARSSPIPIPYKDTLFPTSEYKVSTPYNSESGSLEEFNCYVIIKRPVPKAPVGYNDIVGRPDMRSGTMSSFKSKTNFVKVGGIKSGSVAIPEVVFAEIKELLEQGVYFK